MALASLHVLQTVIVMKVSGTKADAMELELFICQMATLFLEHGKKAVQQVQLSIVLQTIAHGQMQTCKKKKQDIKQRNQ
jgi:hypothetical protein